MCCCENNYNQKIIIDNKITSLDLINDLIGYIKEHSPKVTFLVNKRFASANLTDGTYPEKDICGFYVFCDGVTISVDYSKESLSISYPTVKEDFQLNCYCFMELRNAISKIASNQTLNFEMLNVPRSVDNFENKRLAGELFALNFLPKP